MRARHLLTCVLGGVLGSLLAPLALPAFAQYVGGEGIGGGASGSPNGAFTLNSGASPDATFSESGIAWNDASSFSFTLTNSGAGTVSLSVEGTTTAAGFVSSGATTDFTAASGEAIFIETTGAANIGLDSNQTNGGGLLATTGYTTTGSTGNRGANECSGEFSESVNISAGTRTPLFCAQGTGVLRSIPAAGAAVSITSTPDTTTNPMVAATAGRMSATGASAWTWTEGSASDGSWICFTNTGTNAITITDSDGLYENLEGTGCVVAQYDQVCAEYVTDRWIERVCKIDNVP